MCDVGPRAPSNTPTQRIGSRKHKVSPAFRAQETAVGIRGLCTVVLGIALVAAYVNSGDAAVVASLIIGAVILCVLGRPLRRLFEGFSSSQELLLVYFVVSWVGYLGVQAHRAAWGTDFNRFFDDSFYFAMARLGASDLMIRHSAFDFILALLLRVVSVFRSGEPQLLDVLPLVWLCGAICVGASAAIAVAVAKRRPPLLLLLAVTLGNSIFLDTTIHLYRDAVLLVFLLFAILFALRRNYAVGAVCGAMCTLFRGASGAMALFAVAAVAAAQVGRPSSRAAAIRITVITILSGVVLIGAWATVGRYTGSMSAWRRTPSLEEAGDVSGYAAQRTDRLVAHTGAIVGGRDNSRVIIAAGPAGYPLRLFANVFAPAALKNLTGPTPVIMFGRRDSTVVMTEWMRLSDWLTALMWPLVGPPLVLGLWYVFRRGDGVQRALLALFVVTLIGCSFVSLQPRHRCGLILLFPMFCEVAGGWWVTSRSWIRVLLVVSFAIMVITASLRML